MKASDAEILMIPEPGNDDPDHWLARWQARLSTARIVTESDWNRQGVSDPTGTALAAIEAAAKPVVLVAHSTGILPAILAARVASRRIVGGFFVSPPDLESKSTLARKLRKLGAYPRDPLAFPSMVIASRNDPHGSYDHAGDLANAWGSLLVDAGDSGHLNGQSGHGPWPEGTMVFAQFLSRLAA